MANIALKDITFPGLSNVYEIPEVDNTLSEAGAAADAKKTGDELGALKEDITELQVEVGDASMYTLGLYPQISVADVAVASFDDGADDIPVKSLTVDIAPVQSGSGDPSPSNVRPISGWTGANVSVFDVNQWDEVWEVGGISGEDGADITSNNRIRSKNYISIIPNASYYFGYFGSGVPAFYVCEYDANKNFIKRTQKQRNNEYSFDCAYIRFFVYDENSPITTYNHDICINYPSTDHDYHAYKGGVYAVDWTTEAGTVYGGTLDVTNGVLTVDRQLLALDQIAWTMNVSGQFYSTTTFADVKRNVDGSTVICNKYKSGNAYSEGDNHRICMTGATTGRLWIRDESFSNATTFEASLTGAVAVIEVNTGTTYQLTPTEVDTILGQNNIFADCGNIAELTYRADLKAYIDSHVGS